MRSIQVPRFRLLLLGALRTSRRRSLRGRQPDGSPGSSRGADVLTVGNGDFTQKLTRYHRLMERLLLHGARDARRRSGKRSSSGG